MSTDNVMRLVSEYAHTVAQVQRYRDHAESCGHAVTSAEHAANAKSAAVVARQQFDAIRDALNEATS